MISKILTSVSVITLLFGMQIAVAHASNTATTQEGKPFMEEVKDALQKTKDSITDTSKETYEEVRYTLFGNSDGDRGTEVAIDMRATADGMIDEPVHNAAGERIGTFKDIILNDQGDAVMAIVSDADFIDIGAKEAAFDYALVTQRNTDGDVIMPLTEGAITKARSFSYEAGDPADTKTQRMPANGYSVKNLLSTDILGPDNKEVGSVDNIIFREGRADAVIVSFDKILNMGGKKAALPFRDMQLVKSGDKDAHFQLTSAQAAKFETFKASVSH